MYIGFESNSGHWYEGANVPQFVVTPRPLISQAKRIDCSADWSNLPHGIDQTPFEWVFREDAFDPVTRIRRGRLYEPCLPQPKRDCPVNAHPDDFEDKLKAANNQLRKTLVTYWPCQSFTAPGQTMLGATLVLGQDSSVSAWRVIQVEKVVGNDVMVTLKALTAFGVIPMLDEKQLSGQELKSVERALDRVVDSAFRETPISIVDHCRNAATVILSRWLVKQGAEEEILTKDLGDVAKMVEREPYKKFAAHNAAEVIRLFHPRGKANEQEPKGLRIPVEEDAELAIHSLGFILREIGWAK